jgi:hypothetical protein
MKTILGATADGALIGLMCGLVTYAMALAWVIVPGGSLGDVFWGMVVLFLLLFGMTSGVSGMVIGLVAGIALAGTRKSDTSLRLRLRDASRLTACVLLGFIVLYDTLYLTATDRETQTFFVEPLASILIAAAVWAFGRLLTVRALVEETLPQLADDFSNEALRDNDPIAKELREGVHGWYPRLKHVLLTCCVIGVSFGAAGFLS